MSNMYVELKALTQPGEERSALVDSIDEALRTAVAEDISTVRIVLISFRVFPDGREDHGKPAPPLSGVTAETADAEQVANKVITRFERAVGQGFRGRMLVAVENPLKKNQPIAGVWERYVSGSGSEDPDAYGSNQDDAYGSRQPHMLNQPPPMQHMQPPGMMMGGGGGMPPHQPPSNSFFPEPPEPPNLGGSFLGGTQPRGYDPEYDPGPVTQPDDGTREMVRSIMGAQERRLDAKDEETRYYQQQNTHMLEYFLRQNAQVMQMLHMAYRQSPMLTGGYGGGGGGGGSGGGSNFHPLGELAASIITSVMGRPEAPGGEVGPTAPAPPRFQALPAAQPTFYHPQSDMGDLGGSYYAGDAGPGGGAYAGSHDGQREHPYEPTPGPDVPPPGFDGSRPPSSDEWASAMKMDPDGAMKAAAPLVPAPFRGMLGKGSSNKE